VASIVAGLAFAALISTPRLGWNARVNLGLVFQVLATYGIALSMYLQIPPDAASQPLIFHVLSPSWPAIWILYYAIVVPAPPGRALLAMLVSASAAPVVLWLSLQHAGLMPMTPYHFAVMHVLPYLICVMLAYSGAKIVYRLGADVTRARELGSYRLTERLGAGGMGEVWRASHQLLARDAAIKFIHPESITGAGSEAGALLKRFELEARATASLTSAHTIDVYDFGVTEEGAFYYAMELLEGVDCDALVRRFGPLPAPRVAYLLAQVCESLEEAHARGLIHRDVKPANIYVCRNGRRVDFVKVLDFGLVANPRVADAQRLRLTQPEEMIGTPEFMPPEVVLGKPIDGRADLYGLGCVAFWLLTGRPVFEGASHYEVVAKHLNQTPDPPSQRATDVPPELDRLILDCLEKDPDRRPRDAREVRRRMSEITRGAPWGEEQAERWWDANLPADPNR